jgi:homoserine kinase
MISNQSNRKVSAFAPASMGNVSVGFDCLGACLEPIEGNERLGDVVEISSTSDSRFEVAGPFRDQLPIDIEQNIIVAAQQEFNRLLVEQGIDSQSLLIKLTKNLPVGSGLGSSSSSIVAVLAALNAWYGNPIQEDTLLHLMAKLEGVLSGSVHYDNVAPCYLGGLQLMSGFAAQPSQPIPVFDDWLWVIAYPGTRLNTADARAVLPQQVSLKTTINFGQSLATFITASHRGDETLAGAALTDILAEPYRAALIPGLGSFKQFAKNIGAISSGISGAGPTSFAVFNQKKSAQQFVSWARNHFIQNDTGFVVLCRISQQCVEINDSLPASSGDKQ